MEGARAVPSVELPFFNDLRGGVDRRFVKNSDNFLVHERRTDKTGQNAMRNKYDRHGCSRDRNCKKS